MKKAFLILIMLVFAVSALADSGVDLSGLSFDRLLELQAEVEAALWASDEWVRAEVPPGMYRIGTDIPAGRYDLWLADGYAQGRALTDGGADGAWDEYLLTDGQPLRLELTEGMTLRLETGAALTRAGGAAFAADDGDDTEIRQFVLNTSTRKFHRPDCSNAAKILDKNREEYTGTRSELEEMGYSPCGSCNP